MKKIIIFLLFPILTFGQYTRLNTLYGNLTDTVEKYKQTDVYKCTDALIYKLSIMDSLKFYIDAKQPEKKWYSITKNDAVIMSMQFVSGAADGMHEVLVNHPHTFTRVANWNNHYWLPKESWHNKEHMWTPISDGYHLTASINRTFNYASIAISTGDLFSYKKKDRWKVIAKKFVLSYIANRIGFQLIYKQVFNDHIERRNAGLDQH
jgi:hypothetical protein